MFECLSLFFFTSRVRISALLTEPMYCFVCTSYVVMHSVCMHESRYLVCLFLRDCCCNTVKRRTPLADKDARSLASRRGVGGANGMCCARRGKTGEGRVMNGPANMIMSTRV